MLRSVAEEQLLLLARAFALGAALGILLESFRLFARFFGGRCARFMLDFLFVFAYVASVYGLFRAYTDGQVRWFVLAAQGLGTWAYCKTLGRLLRRPLEKLFRLLGRLLGAVFTLLARPFLAFFSVLQKIFGNFAKFFGEIIKKLFIFLKQYIIITIISCLRIVRPKIPKKRRGKSHGKSQAQEEKQPDISRFFH